MYEKEEYADQLSGHCAPDEFSQDDLCSPVSKCSMPEEKVGQTVNIFHLYVGAGKNV